MSPHKTDTVVIGAGVVGLAIARELAQRGSEVMVLEANAAIGQETSSRNSEVIHAGIYYPPGSLKARLCVEGSQRLYAYCASRGVPHRKDGKLIVAQGADEVVRLRQLAQNAAACGVNDLELVDRARLRELEPAVEGFAALRSPSTGTVDSHALMLALLADLESAGGVLVTRCRVNSAVVTSGGICLNTVSGPGDELVAEQVVNSAGLGACSLAKAFKAIIRFNIPELFFLKGQYFTYSAPSPFTHLVYPLPQAGGLGIHATHDQTGQLRFGPDAHTCATIDYSVDENSKAEFIRSIRPWFPGLDQQKLQPGYAGIRPRLSGSGRLADFRVAGPAEHGVPGLVHLFGIDSPGLTCCLSLARQVADLLN